MKDNGQSHPSDIIAGQLRKMMRQAVTEETQALTGRVNELCKRLMVLETAFDALEGAIPKETEKHVRKLFGEPMPEDGRKDGDG